MFKFSNLRGLYGGLLVAALVATSANYIGEHYGAPVMLMALMIGMAFNFLMDNEKISKGINFSAKSLLRTGIALLGFRITFDELSSLGWSTLLIVAALIAITILSGFISAKFFSRGWRFALLTSGAVAICGASAALAISSVLPKNEMTERNTLFTVIAVTVLSTIAMILYPILFVTLDFHPDQIGFLIGASIHDVAQVIGAGYSISEEVGDHATVVKLIRVSYLPVVIILILLASRKYNTGGRVPIPWFVVVFAGLVVLNSTGIVPDAVRDIGVILSRILLVIAISALGVKTSLKMMTDVGGRHLGMVVCETLVLLFFAICASYLFFG